MIACIVRRALASLAIVTMVASPYGKVLAADVPSAALEIAQPAAEQSAPPPVYGDLGQLDLTATGPLSAALVAPADGSASDSSAPVFDVQTIAGAGVEIAVDDVVVPFTRIGKRTVNNKTGETHYFYYGVPLAEGANHITLTPLGAGGARGRSTHATIYGPGRPVKLITTIEGKPTADGRTPVLVRINATDRFGHHAQGGAIVRLTVVRGDAHFVGVRPRARRDDTPDAAASPPATLAALAQPLPQSEATPLPFATSNPRVAPEPNARIGDVGNALAVGDTATQLQSIDVPLSTGGFAYVRLVPGLQPGLVRLSVSLEQITSDQDIYVTAALRKPLVVGVATAGVGSVPGVPGELATQEDGANARRGRIALYGVGAIAKDAQAQIAYDSANPLLATTQYGGNANDPQERTYLTYGDASTLRDDAVSQGHLYARVDKNKSSAMYGEFQASTAGATGDGYSQLVSGTKVEVAGNNTRVALFDARNNIAYARQIYSPSGLATLGALLHPQIVIGSDVVTLVTLDRRTGAVVTQMVLARNVDYTIDYGSGQIRFINPPLPFDLNFNPQQVLIEYEYAGAGVSAQTIGGRVETGIGPSQAVHVGVGYVNDSTGSTNFSLLSQDVSGRLPGGSWSFVHETAKGSLGSTIATGLASQTIDAAPAQGNAYRASLTETLGLDHVALALDSTSANYSNPFGGLSTAGLLDYHVAYQRAIGTRGDAFTFAFEHEQNNLAGGVDSTSTVSATVAKHVTKRVTVRVGLAVASQRGSSNAIVAAQAAPVAPSPTPAPAAPATAVPTAAPATQTQLEVGAEYRVAPTVAVAVDRIAPLGGGTVASQPTQTTAQVNVDVAKHGRVYVRELWTDSPVQSFAAATGGLTTASGSTHSTAVGIEQNVGANTTVDSEYSVENTGSGSNVYASIGGREKFFLGSHLHGDVALQHGQAAGSGNAEGTGGFNLYGLSLAYAIGNRFRANTDYQLRTGSGSGYTLSAGAAGALSDDVSAAAISNVSNAAGYHNVDDRLTFAFRPSKSDRYVTLVGYESESGNVSALGDRTEIISLEEVVRPDRMLEIAGRYVYKLDGDAYYPAHSSLFGVRVSHRLGARFDLAAETRYLSAHGVPGASTTGFALETGYRIGDTMRVAAGYNFSGSPDPSLAVAPTRRGVYGTVTSVIDSIFGWGASP